MMKLSEASGITQEFTNTYSPWQNGSIERVHRTLANMIRTWFAASHLPHRLWAELYVHASYVYNHLPHTSIGMATPASKFFLKDSRSLTRVRDLHPIGALVIMKREGNSKALSKMDCRNENGYYIGIADDQPGIRMWDANTDTCYVSNHYHVMNTRRYSDTTKESAPKLGIPEGEFIIDTILDERFQGKTREYLVRWHGYSSEHDTWEPYKNVKDTIALDAWEDPSNDAHAFKVITNDADMPSLQEAMRRADWPLWFEGCEAEIDALRANLTWEVVPRETSMKVIRGKWVLRAKRDPETAKITVYKGRWVACGYAQKYGVDYVDTFTPTLSKSGLRLVLAVAVHLDFVIHSVDCKNVFLNGNIDYEIFMEQPDLFIEAGTTRQTHVCKLRKALYGLKQAPLIWNNTLTSALRAEHYEQMEHDPCIFVRRFYATSIDHSGYETRLIEDIMVTPGICILGVYVDDIVIMGLSLTIVEQAKRVIKSLFEM